MKRLILVLSLVSAILIAGCGSGSSDTSAPVPGVKPTGTPTNEKPGTAGAEDPSKADRGAGDMPGGGPTGSK